MIPAFFRAVRSNETVIHELNYLFWECTTRCNLHCRHCGSDCYVSSRDADMPGADFLKALDTVPKEGRASNFLVVMTGGEPLVRKDIAGIGHEIVRRGCRWGMVSNGWLYTRERQSELLENGMSSLTISLDGLEQSHDWMRGVPGSHARALDAIRLAAGVPTLNFDVVTCVNKRNFSELHLLRDLLESIGVRQWRIFTVIPIGRAAGDPLMQLSGGEFRSLMDFIAGCRKDRSRSMKVTFSCEGYVGPYEDKVRDSRFFCHAGINIASVLVDGRICACPNIDRDVFSQGNIYDDNLYDVWQHRFVQFRNRDWARRGICSDCREWRNCLGNGMHNWHGDCSGVLKCHCRLLSEDRQ